MLPSIGRPSKYSVSKIIFVDIARWNKAWNNTMQQFFPDSSHLQYIIGSVPPACQWDVSKYVTILNDSSRLSLYSGVILHELHLATMDLVKRQWNSGDKTALTEEIKEARDFLLKAQEVLRNEICAGTGSKLANLICDSLKNFGRWLDLKGILLAP